MTTNKKRLNAGKNKLGQAPRRLRTHSAPEVSPCVRNLWASVPTVALDIVRMGSGG